MGQAFSEDWNSWASLGLLGEGGCEDASPTHKEIADANKVVIWDFQPPPFPGLAHHYGLWSYSRCWMLKATVNSHCALEMAKVLSMLKTEYPAPPRRQDQSP